MKYLTKTIIIPFMHNEYEVIITSYPISTNGIIIIVLVNTSQRGFSLLI